MPPPPHPTHTIADAYGNWIISCQIRNKVRNKRDKRWNMGQYPVLHTNILTHTHTHIYTYIHTCLHTYTHINSYTHTIYIHKDVSVAEWLVWLTSNCRQISAKGSSPSNGLKPNLWGQKGFNPLCQCIYVKHDIQTIHRCSHTSIYTHILIHTYNIHRESISRRSFLAL